MSRIRHYYENRFRKCLRARGVADVNEETESLFVRIEERSRLENAPPHFVLACTYAELVRGDSVTHYPRKFFCDAGLGGLARWLRAAGYETGWNPALDDAAVIREAQRRRATLITTDSLMMERGVLRDDLVPNIFVPSTLTCEQQLEIVFRMLSLDVGEPRCMNCGGPLRRVDKASVSARIPPKTALWLDEYFICAECDRLFWRGTHLQKIRRALDGIRQSAGHLKIAAERR